MSSPLASLWETLGSIDVELASALRGHREELAKLKFEIGVRLELANRIGREDLRERANQLLAQIQALEAISNSEAVTLTEEPVVEIAQPEVLAIPAPPAAVIVEPAIAEVVPLEVTPDAKPALDLPKRIAAKPNPSKSKQKDFAKKSQAFHAREIEANHESTQSRKGRFVLRSLICEARGLLELGREIEAPANSVEESVQHLRRLNGDLEFFGLNYKRSHSAQIWFELADAYRLLADVEEALPWADPEKLTPAEREELLDMMAAADASLPRLNSDHGCGFTDLDQADQKADLDKIKGKAFIKWWQFKDSPPPIKELFNRAGDLAPYILRKAEQVTKRSNREMSQQHLEDLIEAIRDDAYEMDFVERLRQLVESCLENGVRSSNIDFCNQLLPYQHQLNDLRSSHGAELLKQIKKLENKLLANHKSVGDPEFDEPESEIVISVRSWLSGKNVLMIGGKPATATLKKLREGLGCKLEWPDSTESTKIEEFRPAVSKADIVCRFIRWSRHNYKDVLDWATEQGKPTVTFKAGSGLNRVIHDMHLQLRGAFEA